jgi:hypothetical protein
MKKFIFLLTVVVGLGLSTHTKAQVQVSVNIGNQPVWGPVGYDYVDYYYFPERDVYYHVPDRQFIYFDHGSWISGYSLPGYYGNFDPYRSYKVVINEPRPFVRNDYWHSRYYAYRGQPQQIIYNSRDPKYYVINEHPEHARWMASRVNNDRGYNNMPGNYGRNDVGRYEKINNNQRNYDLGKIDRDRNDRSRNDNGDRSGNYRRWSQNDQMGNNNDGFRRK